MLVEEVIKKAYNLLVNDIIKDIPDIYKEEISKNYLDYLYKMYSNKEVSTNNTEKLLKTILRIEKIRWEKCDSIYILQWFKDDKSFNIINSTSKDGFKLAILSLQNNDKAIISLENANKNINILINELNNVLEFNKHEAKHLVSEGILDFKYASGNNEVMSFRLSHIESKIKEY